MELENGVADVVGKWSCFVWMQQMEAFQFESPNAGWIDFEENRRVEVGVVGGIFGNGSDAFFGRYIDA